MTEQRTTKTEFDYDKQHAGERLERPAPACEFGASCDKPAAVTVIHKAIGARPSFERHACMECAGHIADVGKSQRLIDTSSRESRFYKIEGLRV